MIPNYLIETPLNTKIIIGTSGNANGKPEYIGEAPPGSATSEEKWRIKLLTYDANGNVTDITWADGNNNMNKKMDEYSSYSYS